MRQRLAGCSVLSISFRTWSPHLQPDWCKSGLMWCSPRPQFFAAVAGCALAAARRPPFVMEVSDLWHESIVAVGAMRPNVALRWLEKLELLLYRRAARVIVLTSVFKENLTRRGVPGYKVDVVLNGVDLARFSPRPRDAELARRWGLSAGDFVVGYIATLGMAHGLRRQRSALRGLAS